MSGLTTLQRVRRLELDRARAALAETLAAEDAARAHHGMLLASIEAETRAAERSTSDAAVETFAAWLAETRRRLRAAEARLETATGATALRRAELTLARAAYEAVTKAIETQEAARRDARTRAETAAMQDIALNRQSHKQ